VKWGVFKDGRVGTGWWSRRRPKPKDKARTESTQRWGPAPVNPRRRQPLNEWKLSLNAAEIDDALDAGPAAHSESHSDCRRRTVECPFYIVSQTVSQSVSWSVEWSCRYLFSVFPSHLFWPYLTNILSFWQWTHGPASLPTISGPFPKAAKVRPSKKFAYSAKATEKRKTFYIYIYRKCQCKSPPYLATSLGHKTAAVMRHSDFLCFPER